MKKINCFIMICLLATMAFLTGCKDDETPIPSDPVGTVTVFMRDGNDAGEQTYITPKNCNFPFYINSSDNFEGENWKFVIFKEMLGLADIVDIPSDPDWWTLQVAVKPGYGYIAECTNNENEFHYVRIYVTEWVKSTSGGITGAEVKYQWLNNDEKPVYTK